MNRSGKIIFFNQMAGPLFRWTAESIATQWPESVLLTGHQDTLRQTHDSNLNLISAPPYDRRSLLSRLTSWLSYMLAAVRLWWISPRESFLFFSSNPPMLPVLGLIGQALRKQRYAIVVYDIYPDVLTRLKRIKPQGLVDRFWTLFNYLVYTRAEVVFVLTPGMARTLCSYLPESAFGKVVVVPIWVEANTIKPIPRRNNHFFKSNRLADRFTVLYAGNLGATHDVGTVLRAAEQLQDQDDLQFLFVGHGNYEAKVREAAQKQANLFWWPYQPEGLLPHLLSCGDVAIISLDEAGEGVIFPSRLAYHLAAGSPVVGVCQAGGDLAHILESWECGLVVPTGDVMGLLKAIDTLRSDPITRKRMGQRAREAALHYFNPKNALAYVKALEPYLSSNN